MESSALAVPSVVILMKMLFGFAPQVLENFSV